MGVITYVWWVQSLSILVKADTDLLTKPSLLQTRYQCFPGVFFSLSIWKYSKHCSNSHNSFHDFTDRIPLYHFCLYASCYGQNHCYQASSHMHEQYPGCALIVPTPLLSFLNLKNWDHIKRHIFWDAYSCNPKSLKLAHKACLYGIVLNCINACFLFI